MLTSNVSSKLRYDILCHKCFLHKWLHTLCNMTSSIIPSLSILNIWQLRFNSWQPRTITLLKFVVDKKLASINICTAVWLKQKKNTSSISYLQDFYGIFQQFRRVLKLSSTQNHLSKFYLHVLGREPFLSAWNADT